MATPASPEVEEMARSYMAIRIWSAPAAITLYALSGWLIAHERTKALLILQIWMNGLNIILDLWFVLGLGWGVEGVAIATLIAEWSGFFLALYMCRGVFKGDQWRNWARIFDRAKIKAMASVNGNIMLRSLLLQIILIGFMFKSASIGDVTLAANQILIQFLNITAYGLDGFAIAAESLIGVSMGAKSRLNIRRTAIMTSLWSGVGAVMMALFFGFFGIWLIKIMATSVEVQDAAALYLPWMVVSPIIGFGSWVLDGIFIGATRSRDMRNAMFQSTIVFVFAVLILHPLMGNHGLWLALLISYVARTITLMRYYPALETAADR
ncbi:MAG: MATE family efflux transporter [Rhodobacteraceae bacterium]|nr:MATE family efflux transporter [Paracoccaceae bacterium]